MLASQKMSSRAVWIYFHPTASLSRRATRPIETTYNEPTITPVHNCLKKTNKNKTKQKKQLKNKDLSHQVRSSARWSAIRGWTFRYNFLLKGGWKSAHVIEKEIPEIGSCFIGIFLVSWDLCSSGRNAFSVCWVDQFFKRLRPWMNVQKR